MPVKFRKLAPIVAMPAFDGPRLLRIPQAATYLNCSIFSVRELIRNQELRKIKLGKAFLIDRRDLDVWIDRRKIAA